MHRPWYIDFRGDPLICSKVDFAKNVIFENVAEANARVYWEVYHFAKAMSKDNSNFRMGPWWANQRTFFDRLRMEFNLDIWELRPCRRSSVRIKDNMIAPTMCTAETLLGTKGLLLMLLHWATNFKSKAGRAEARAILQDLFRRVFSAVDVLDHRLISLPTSEIIEGNLDWPQLDVTSRPAAATMSIEYLFANRQNKGAIRAHLVQWVDVLEAVMTKLILTGKVGQLNPTALPTFLTLEKANSCQTKDKNINVRKVARETWGFLPEKLMMAWNDKWACDSMYTFKELLKAIRNYISEKMAAKVPVDKSQFESWLRRNGWMKQCEAGAQWWKKGSLVCQLPWYIDFVYDPCRCSKLDCTKNEIILNGEKSAPEVYWEVRSFAKTLNNDNIDFQMLTWWKNQKRSFEKLHREFQFHELTLLPSRRSAFAQKKPWSVAPTQCTKETLMATNGLIVMLLHYTDHTRRKAYRIAAKEMLIDLMRRLFSAMEDDDALWSKLRLGEDRTAATGKTYGNWYSVHDSLSKINSRYEGLVNSLKNAFTDRKKCQQMWIHFVNTLNIVAQRMNEIILKRQVGQASSPMECMQNIKRSIDHCAECEQNASQESFMKRKRKYEKALQTSEPAKGKASATDVERMRQEKKTKRLDPQFDQASIRGTRKTKEQKREGASRSRGSASATTEIRNAKKKEG